MNVNKQRGSLTMSTALFALSIILIAAFFALNKERETNIRVQSALLADDISFLQSALAIHYQQTCATGVIPNNDVVGVYFPNLRRTLNINDYSLEIIQAGINAFLVVSVFIPSSDTKYTNLAIAQGAVLNGNVLTKRSPLTIFQNSRVSLVSQSNDISRVSNC